MEWQVIVALLLVITVIFFPAAFVWYLNIEGLRAAIREGKFRVLEVIGRMIRNAVAVMVPLAIYVVAVWFFFGNFGWPVALALSLVLPIVLLVPVLVWATVVSGLYQVIRDSLRRRVTAPRRRAMRTAEETVLRKVG